MKNKLGIIGGGNMGEAILNCVRKQYSVLVSEKDKTRAGHLQTTYYIKIETLKTVVETSEIVLIAVKPQDFEDVLREIKPWIDERKLVVSIAAGITTAYIEKIFGKNVRVIRTMPNMPAMIASGITAVCPGRYAKKTDVETACKIFNHLGKTVIVQEQEMDAITAVSGSGPAYLFCFLECLMKAAQALGLKEDLSKELVASTFLGSALLLDQQKADPGALRAKVTSKGGTTEAALAIFEKNKLEEIIAQALQAARKRAEELSRR